MCLCMCVYVCVTETRELWFDESCDGRRFNIPAKYIHTLAQTFPNFDLLHRHLFRRVCGGGLCECVAILDHGKWRQECVWLDLPNRSFRERMPRKTYNPNDNSKRHERRLIFLRGEGLSAWGNKWILGSRSRRKKKEIDHRTTRPAGSMHHESKKKKKLQYSSFLEVLFHSVDFFSLSSFVLCFLLLQIHR